MNELIESGDPRAKVVGRPSFVSNTLEDRLARFDRHQQNFGQMWGALPFRKGLYRFTSFEEFDVWKTNLMMRNSPARR